MIGAMKRFFGGAKRLERFQEFYDAPISVDLERLDAFRNDCFPPCRPTCWIDEPNALLLVDERLSNNEISTADAEMCRKFIVDGYYIVEGLVAPDFIDVIWDSYEAGLKSGAISVHSESHGDGDPWPGRRLDPHIEIPKIRELQWHPEILRICGLLFGRKTLPFQTIMGHKGSAQLAHSDAIHMTSYPIGYLLAAWIAMEDIHPESGPLFYYPRSHRLLPYLLSGDIGIGLNEFKKDPGVYHRKYEAAVAAHVSAFALEKKTFSAKKGDVLFWHSNLLHGGSAREDLHWSRKACVCHYFAERTVTYHDLSGNLSRLHRNGVYAPIVLDPPSA